MKAAILLSLSIGLFLLSSCGEQAIAIHSGNITLSNIPLVFKLSTPVSRNKEFGGILLDLVEKWSLYDLSTKQICLTDKSIVSIEILLFDENGKKYQEDAIGSMGDRYVAYFKINPDVKITRIEISASSKLTCRHILWYYFNPI